MRSQKMVQASCVIANSKLGCMSGMSGIIIRGTRELFIRFAPTERYTNLLKPSSESQLRLFFWKLFVVFGFWCLAVRIWFLSDVGGCVSVVVIAGTVN